MKPAPFDYVRATTIEGAIRALEGDAEEAKVIAGGQSLGPAMNLRLAQPDRLVDVRSIAVLGEVTQTPDGLLFGSCVTHAAIEDERVPDCTGGMMRHVAAEIAYRAVRARGTIGGSVCHADPAADWLTAMLLLAASVVIEGPPGRREMPVERFVVGPYGVALGEAEIVVGIRVPRLPRTACWSTFKFCRKPGEFAEAMAAVLCDDARGVRRAVIGALDGPPCVIDDASFLAGGFDAALARAAVEAAQPEAGGYEQQVRFAALARAAAGLARMAA